VMEKLLEEVSFTASEKSGSAFTVDANIRERRVAPLAKNTDLSKFIL
jgi:ATP-dependent HslUV protease ATP-binding subunit HslU